MFAFVNSENDQQRMFVSNSFYDQLSCFFCWRITFIQTSFLSPFHVLVVTHDCSFTLFITVQHNHLFNPGFEPGRFPFKNLQPSTCRRYCENKRILIFLSVVLFFSLQSLSRNLQRYFGDPTNLSLCTCADKRLYEFNPENFRRRMSTHGRFSPRYAFY